jgi:Tfp pilus assembly protein PilX
MTTMYAARRSAQSFRRTNRGSVLIVALLLAAIVGISLVSYIKLCTTSLKLSHRSFFADAASNLVETGLEEAIWCFNQVGAGTPVASVWSAANGWTTNSSSVGCVMVTNGGGGYTTPPTVTLSGGGGS